MTGYGVSIFVWIMWKLIRNQVNSVTAIEEEIHLRRNKVKEQPADISEKLLPRFSKLGERVKHQRAVLNGVRGAVLLVWIITTLIVVDAQWPAFFPHVIESAVKVVSTAGDRLRDAWTWVEHSFRSR